tara:strand:+ start:396 stop:803 length:408 start_codon:yes stop_codon:yes gene_type:complete
LKKVLKFFILIFVFGLPVGWYLFLQAFGQNQFQLSPVGMVNETCKLESSSLYILDTAVIDHQKLQLQRLLLELTDNNWSYHYYSSNEDCFGDLNGYPLILVGDNREIIGNYKLSIEEVDRVLVEFDLLNYLRDML